MHHDGSRRTEKTLVGEKDEGPSLNSHENRSLILKRLLQLRPAIPDVKGPPNLICYWRIFVIANIGIKKEMA